MRNRVVMITGASSGIGRATARRIGAAGGTVALVARTQEKLDQARAEIVGAGGTAHVHRCDLSNLDDVERMAAEALEQYGRVDILVNNAGRSIRRPIDRSYDRMHDFLRTMQLNYFGAVKLTLLLLPGMRQRRCGHIVNVSSIGVQLDGPGFSAYTASKAALDAFSGCIAPEIRADNVRISTVYMPLVLTPMVDPHAFPNARAISADAAADMVICAIVRRPERMTTPFGRVMQVARAVDPRVARGVNVAYHLISRRRP